MKAKEKSKNHHREINQNFFFLELRSTKTWGKTTSLLKFTKLVH